MFRKHRKYKEHAPLMASYTPFDFLLNFDGSCDPNPGGDPTFGWVVMDHNLVELKTGRGVAEEKYPRTNNTAEFSGMLDGLRYCVTIANGGTIRVRGDSQLVLYAMVKGWPMRKSPHLAELANWCRGVVKAYHGRIEFEWVRRDQNARADGLAEADNPKKKRKKTRNQIIAGLPQSGGEEIARLERVKIIEWLKARAELIKEESWIGYSFLIPAIEELEANAHHGAKP